MVKEGEQPMLRPTKRVVLGPDLDLLRLVEAVKDDKEPRVLEKDGEDVAVVVSTDEYFGLAQQKVDIWEGYDPQKVKQALRRSAGALSGVDTTALIKDIYAARQQGSRGRPA